MRFPAPQRTSEEIGNTQRTLETVETTLESLRETKWTLVKELLEELRSTVKTLEAAETAVGHLRDTKWEIVRSLKNAGHDFRATTEGMDIVLSSSPSFNWS